MKRTAIGSTEIPIGEPYWSDGRNADRLRQSEREIFSMIDLYQEICTYEENDAIVSEYYGEMDKLYFALKLIEEFGQFPLFLKNSGMVFAELVASGIFSTPYATLTERNISIDEIIQNAIDRLNNHDLPVEYPKEVRDWWDKIVVEQNFYINLATGKQIKQPAIIAGIGNTQYDEFCARMKDGGPFYLYVAAPVSMVDTEQSFYKKQQQNYTIDKMESTGVGLTRNVMMNNINAGIISSTKGKNAQTALGEFKQGKDPGIGLISIILKAITALFTLITSILAIKQAKIEQRTAEILSKDNINNQAPDFSDWQKYKDPVTGDIITIDPKTGQIVNREKDPNDSNKFLIPALLGGAALLVLLMN